MKSDLKRDGTEFAIVLAAGEMPCAQARAKKRLFDIMVGTLATLAAIPLTLIVALAILVDDGGPILFVQPRIGRGNRVFRIYKFRTMHTAVCDPGGHVSISTNDLRITRVGRLIRSSGLDELPQLFNVLKGDMSLVGPRPHALGSRAGEKLFWEVDPLYWRRHIAKPGITGIAQVSGLRGATLR